MEFFQEIGLFLAEAVILVTAIIVVILAIAAASQRRKGGEEGYIEVRRLNDRYTAFHDAVRSFTEHAETRKVREKAEKKSAKAEQKQARQQAKEEAGNEDGKQGDGRLFVLRFQGDIRASETESLREEISAISADNLLSDKLKIEEGAPVLKRERVVLDRGMSPLEYNIGYYKAKDFKYSLELRRDIKIKKS